MLSNAYFLAKFRFDTAENEPAKNLQKFAKFANFADPNQGSRARGRFRRAGGERCGRGGARGGARGGESDHRGAREGDPSENTI